MQATSRRIPNEDRSNLLASFNRNKGCALVPGFAVSQRVEYHGMLYTLLDHDANDAAPLGSTPIIISDDFLMVRDIEWSEIKRA